jgi:dTDP-4-dehydrorhamnose 3,5-epimerase
MGNLIRDVLVTKLKIMPHPDGEVRHGLRSDDPCFLKFSEAYFSEVNYKKIKAWKKHNLMTLNLIVINGEVMFVVFDDRVDSPDYGKFMTHRANCENYTRITIPPGLWVGFQGLEDGRNTILNIADYLHDPNESSRLEPHDIPYEWEFS